MPAYVVVEVEVLDAAEFARYAELVPPTIAAYGGRYLARGGQTALLDGAGGPAPKRLVILEFPTLERARDWEASPEYAPAKAIRQRAARVRMVAIEGATR
jgi:uncharacterized protein (DUF1330 family)